MAVRIDNSYSYKEVATGTPFQWNSDTFYANYGGINKNVKLHITGLVHQTLPLFSNLGTVGTYVYGQNYNIPGQSAVIHADTQVQNEDDRQQQSHAVRRQHKLRAGPTLATD